MKRGVPTDEIERIRTLLATNDGAAPFSVARNLLAALDAERAEVERLRGERDQARRKAIEEAIATAEACEMVPPVNVRERSPEWARYSGAESTRRTIVDCLRALLDGPDAP